MAQIHVGKKIPYELIPVDENDKVRKLERPAVVSVTAPAVIESTSPDNLKGFVQNPSGEDVDVIFTADGDAKMDGADTVSIHYEATINLLGADAVAFRTNVFGDEVSI